MAYFDPDIEVFAPLEDIRALARRHGILLTRTRRSRYHATICFPAKEMLLQVGIDNLGFIAIGREGGDHLDWWGRAARVATASWTVEPSTLG